MLGFIPPGHICQALVDGSSGRNPETRLRAPPGVQAATRASLTRPGEGRSPCAWIDLFFPGVGQVRHCKRRPQSSWGLSGCEESAQTSPLLCQKHRTPLPSTHWGERCPRAPHAASPHIPAETKPKGLGVLCVCVTPLDVRWSNPPAGVWGGDGLPPGARPPVSAPCTTHCTPDLLPPGGESPHPRELHCVSPPAPQGGPGANAAQDLGPGGVGAHGRVGGPWHLGSGHLHGNHGGALPRE